MKSMIFEFQDADYTRTISALSKRYGYQSTLTDVKGNVTPNPQSQEDFALAVVIKEFFQPETKAHEVRVAAKQAEDTIVAPSVSINKDGKSVMVAADSIDEVQK